MTSPNIPMVPSEPTSRRHRSNPLTFFTVGPPAFATSPSAVTKRAWSRVSRAGPRPSRRMSLAAVANAPPMVPPDSSATICPAPRSAISISSMAVPAPQRNVISAGLYSIMPLGACTMRTPCTWPPRVLRPAIVTGPEVPIVSANAVRSIRSTCRGRGCRCRRSDSRRAIPCRDSRCVRGQRHPANGPEGRDRPG